MKKITDMESYLKVQKELFEKKKVKENTKILVGLGTCGIAAGAEDIYEALEESIISGDLTNGELVKVGCVGYCHAEPTIELLYPDGTSVLLGHLHANTVSNVIASYIATHKKKGKHVLEKNIAKDTLN